MSIDRRRLVMLLIPLAWLWGWLFGEWQQAVQRGWQVSTGNPPSTCCGGGGGGGFPIQEGPTNLPNNGRKR